MGGTGELKTLDARPSSWLPAGTPEQGAEGWSFRQLCLEVVSGAEWCRHRETEAGRPAGGGGGCRGRSWARAGRRGRAHMAVHGVAGRAGSTRRHLWVRRPVVLWLGPREAFSVTTQPASVCSSLT